MLTLKEIKSVWPSVIVLILFVYIYLKIDC